MPRQFKSFLTKILLLTSIIVIVFNIGSSLLNADKSIGKNNVNETSESESKNTNSVNFKTTHSGNLGRTGVAISTNLGIRYKQRTEIPATIYKDVFSINDLKLEGFDANNILIASNMITTQEYKNVLRSDIKTILSNSRDKAIMLNAIIEQLEFRYEKALIEMRKLIEQKNIFEREMQEAITKKNAIKTKIDVDFRANNAKESAENIKTYLEIQNDYYYARTYIVFINQFLREYDILNEYNKRLLDTLINNKTAIIRESYVVIPDTGLELLREFDLLIEEADYKANR